MIRKINENKSAIKNVRESHASDWALARPNHAKIQSIIDKYELNPETVLNDLLSYMADPDLAGFAKDLKSDYADDEEEDDD